MLKLGVLVSGGGTNLQAIMDAIDSGVITNAEVGLVISNNPGAYALKRAESRGIPAKCISPKKFENREEFHKALLQELQENKVELVVLAGFLVAIPPMIVEAYPNRIINIHPSLIPSFWVCLHAESRLAVQRFILWIPVQIQDRSSFKKRWKYSRETLRRCFNVVLWRKQNGKSFRKQLI